MAQKTSFAIPLLSTFLLAQSQKRIAGVNVEYVTQSAVAVDHNSSSKDERKGHGIYSLRLKIKLKPSETKLY